MARELNRTSPQTLRQELHFMFDCGQEALVKRPCIRVLQLRFQGTSAVEHLYPDYLRPSRAEED